MVQSDREILGGTPVFIGTRVPVQALFDYLEGQHSMGEFLDGFPSVTRVWDGRGWDPVAGKQKGLAEVILDQSNVGDMFAVIMEHKGSKHQRTFYTDSIYGGAFPGTEAILKQGLRDAAPPTNDGDLVRLRLTTTPRRDNWITLELVTGATRHLCPCTDPACASLGRWSASKSWRTTGAGTCPYPCESCAGISAPRRLQSPHLHLRSGSLLRPWASRNSS